MSVSVSSGRRHDPREFVELFRPLNLSVADGPECDAGRQIAADLISPHVALAATFRRVQEHTGSAVVVTHHEGEVVGVLGVVPLRPEGLAAVEQHLFDPKNPPQGFLSRPGEPFAALYGWGFAARTRRASALVVTGAMKLRERYPDIPFFTRAATPAGVKVICGRMGYSPYPGAPDDLLWNPVRPANEERAA